MSITDRVPTLPTNRRCPKCQTLLVCEKHEASDGGHVDLCYTCPVCSFYQWIDGSDA